MVATANQLYRVGGVLLERPFMVRRLGHVGFHFTDMPGALHFYRDLLGFRISDTIDFRTRVDPAKLEGLDPHTYFTRFATDHHSFVFGSKQVREIARPGASAHNRVDDMGQISWQVDIQAELAFYTEKMGFTITERVQLQGETVYFLRANYEHHSLALYPTALKERLGVPAQSTCASMGFQVGSYKQLRDAVSFLKSKG